MLTRINPLGLKYYILRYDEDSTKIIHNGKYIIVNVDINEISMRWYKWQMQSDYIQNAFDILLPSEREFLMTGITPVEWDEIFKDQS